MKYCIHCGREVLDDAIICPGCGCSVQYGNDGEGFTKSNNGSAQQRQVPPFADNYSGLSIGGFILSFFSPLIGLILSIVAHNEAKRTGSGKSLSMSKAGIIISSVLLGLVALVVLFWFIFFFSVVVWI